MVVKRDIAYDIVYDVVYDVQYMISYTTSCIPTISYMMYSIRCRIRCRMRHRRYSSTCLNGCKSAGHCHRHLVLHSTCVSKNLQLFSELGSLTCDADCALTTRATPTLGHTPSDSVDVCWNCLVLGPPLLPPASPSKQDLFEERPFLTTPTPGFRGYAQP